MPVLMSLGQSSNSGERSRKGKSLVAFPSNYVVLDLETTGLDPSYDDIIEFAALRVRSGTVVDSFQTFIKPIKEIDEFITELTGITNEMLASAPSPITAFPIICDFIGDDVVVGHNVNFDVNFLYDRFRDVLNSSFSNDFVDTMRISRKLFPELKHHRLIDVCGALDVQSGEFHRALIDCHSTFDCFSKMRLFAIDLFGSEVAFFKEFQCHKKKLDLQTVSTDKTDFDETHPLYNRVCVFTGALERMTRAEAAQCVVDVGGTCGNGITKNTNFLILGNNDYCNTIKDGKSSKQKKAEAYKLKGCDVEIIPESVFYDMLQYGQENKLVDNDDSPEIFFDFDTGLITPSDGEKEALRLICEALGPTDSQRLHLERRSNNYLSVIKDESHDFCRIKIGDKSKWFSLSMWGIDRAVLDDPRLESVNNKNQRHWKIALSSIEDISKYSDFIRASFNVVVEYD